MKKIFLSITLGTLMLFSCTNSEETVVTEAVTEEVVTEETFDTVEVSDENVVVEDATMETAE